MDGEKGTHLILGGGNVGQEVTFEKMKLYGEIIMCDIQLIHAGLDELTDP